MDIAAWLRSLGLQQYEQAFRDHEINGNEILTLTAEDLKDLGVGLVGHRRRLLDAIAALRTAVLSEPSTGTSAQYPTHATSADGERRQVSVMFCDLVGSVALSTRLDPEDLRNVVGIYQRCCAKLIGKFGGFVTKYLGDGILAYFGYPEAHEDDAERAVRAGLALVEAVATLQTSEPLQLRVGVATGLAVVGHVIGSGASQEQDVVGETPNLAARLQALAEPNTVVIAEGTRRQVGSLFEMIDLGPQDIKGFAERQRAWRIVGESQIQNRFEALRSGETPLIGREEEMNVLQRRWASAKAGEGCMVSLSAEPGIGKSRLATTLVDRLRPEPHATLQYFCSPHHQDSALFPVIARLEQTAGFELGDALEVKLKKLEMLVTSNSRVAEDVALLAELLSLPLGDRSLDYSPQRKKEKTLDALVRQLAGLAEHQPVLLIFEDLQWIDPTSRELLDLIIRRIERLSVLMIVTFRPEFQSPWAGLSEVTSLILTRLARRDSEALVRQVARNATSLPDEIVKEIIEHSDGVPLFLEEVTKAVLEGAGGAAASQTKRTASIVTGPAHIVPATLLASLMARLDRLGFVAKEVAQVGAAIGREFSYELLAATSRRTPGELNEAVGRLLEAGLIFQRGTPPQAMFLFKHALVQDAAYSTLLREPRHNLHARLADALLSMNETEAVAPETIARHLQRAERRAEAIVYWRKAGEQAARRAGNREAEGHFRRALSLLEAQPETNERRRAELAILSQLAPALMAVHGMAAAEVGKVVERATEVGQRLESSQELAPSIANLWMYHFASGRLDAAAGISAKLFRIAREHDDPEILLQAYHTAWPVDWLRGSLTVALKHIDLGLALYDEERHAHHRFVYFGHDPCVCGLGIAQHIYWALGYPTRASDAGDKAITLARRLKHEPTLVHALWFACEGHTLSRDVAAIMANTSELLKLTEEYKLPQQRATGRVIRGWAMAVSGKVAEGLALADEGIAWLERSANRGFLARLYMPLAETYLLAGRHAEGLQLMERGPQILSEMGNSFYLPRLLQIKAKLLEATGRHGEAEASLRQSLDVARAQGAKAFELRAAIGLARLWLSQGKRDEARSLLRPICDSFVDGFDTPDFKEAKELLEAHS